MTTLLEFREKLKVIYGRYSLYILPVLKFIFALLIFISINRTLGFMEILENPFVIIILSLICAIMPLSVTTGIAVIMIIGHCYTLGIEIAVFGIVLFITMGILYFRFAPGSSLALLVTPLAFGAQVPGVVPIAYGLLGGPASFISVVNGVITYYFIKFVGANANVLQGKDISQIPNKLKLLIDGLVKNQSLIIGVISCVSVVIIVYIIRRMSIQYAWRISIIVGALTYLIIQTGFSLIWNDTGSIFVIILGTLGAIIVSLILEFFFFHVDYTRTEQVQFEDDEYYYYVKAVPKVNITTPERDIRNISREEVPLYRKEEKIKVPPIEKPKAMSKMVMREPKKEMGDSGNPFMDSDLELLPHEMKRGVANHNFDDVDFEKKLEESLRNL